MLLTLLHCKRAQTDERGNQGADTCASTRADPSNKKTATTDAYIWNHTHSPTLHTLRRNCNVQTAGLVFCFFNCSPQQVYIMRDTFVVSIVRDSFNKEKRELVGHEPLHR